MQKKNAGLLNTLISFVKCGGDLVKTGEAMSQHKILSDTG